jgi:3-dehydroquinate dehydratase II
MARLLLLNGPNLNLLGQREPEVYGSDTLASIEERATLAASRLGHELVAFQSNAEHELIDRVQTARANGIAFGIINPGGFTHTSVALRDALLGVKLPFIELHLSNTFSREKFRHHSYFSDIAVGCIVGLGAHGYELAVMAAAERIRAQTQSDARPAR